MPAHFQIGNIRKNESAFFLQIISNGAALTLTLNTMILTFSKYSFVKGFIYFISIASYKILTALLIHI